MIGDLPKALEVGGKMYAIRSDYRNIFRIITAFSDKELTDNEKVYICLKRLYVDFESISDYEGAYKAAVKFIDYTSNDSGGRSPRLVNWEKDEQLIFADINRVAGKEVRDLEYMHWWTFMGYAQNVDKDGIWGFILTIRQKKAKGKKLEQHEREFYNANRELCSIDFMEDRLTPEDELKRIYEDILRETKERG